MGAISDIFRQFSPEYLRRFGDTMPKEHHKVIEAIMLCRTKDNGTVVYQCEQCGLDHILNRSCGNRHCPQCQNHKTRLWLDKQMERMLPGQHFMITFTVPEELRDFIRSHQRICYAALFAASSDAMKKLCLDPRHVGGDLPGFFGVLHTWGRQLQYHPHIHYVVPGGAISTADGRWRHSGEHFFVPVKALSAIFRAKFMDRMKKAGLAGHVPQEVWRKSCLRTVSKRKSIRLNLRRKRCLPAVTAAARCGICLRPSRRNDRHGDRRDNIHRHGNRNQSLSIKERLI